MDDGMKPSLKKETLDVTVLNQNLLYGIGSRDQNGFPKISVLWDLTLGGMHTHGITTLFF